MSLLLTGEVCTCNEVQPCCHPVPGAPSSCFLSLQVRRVCALCASKHKHKHKQGEARVCIVHKANLLIYHPAPSTFLLPVGGRWWRKVVQLLNWSLSVVNLYKPKPFKAQLWNFNLKLKSKHTGDCIYG